MGPGLGKWKFHDKGQQIIGNQQKGNSGKKKKNMGWRVDDKRLNLHAPPGPTLYRCVALLDI